MPDGLSDEALAALSDAVEDAILLVDSEGQIVLANEAARDMFQRETLVGRPVELLIPSRYRDAHDRDRAAFVQEPFSRPMGVGLELYGVRSDGVEFPVEVSLAPFVSNGVTMTVAAIRDRSPQKRGKSQPPDDVRHLAQAQKLEAVRQLVGGIAHDFSNHLMVIAALSEHLSGDPALATHARELGQIETAAEKATALSRQLLSFSRGGGESEAADAAAYSRERAEREKAAEAQRHIADIAAATQVGLEVWQLDDPDDPASLRLVYANPASSAARGLPVGALGRTIYEVLPEAEATQAAMLAEVARGGESRSLGDLTLTYPDDAADRRSFAVRIFPLPERGVGVAFNNVTDQRKLEARLRQAEKLEALGSLAGGVAHDFNNILTVVRAAAAIALGELGDGPARVKVEQIDAAAAHAAAVTRHLLAFSRQQVLHPEPTDLNTIVEGTLDLLGHLLDEDIEFSRQLDRDLDAILIDRNQLQQVILNLCVNARDAMPDGGTIAVRTATVNLDEDYAAERVEVTPGTYALLEITDSGTGIDARTQSRVFDPFFTTKPEGTGLGLATVHGIVKQSGGHIALYSEIGQGTTFKIYLPYSDQPVGAPRQPPAHVTSLEGSETILLVDDNDMVRPLVAEMLERYGYTVLTASSGSQAITIAQEHPSIDLLLTDVVMPGMTGGALAEKLASTEPRLKVLFTSGYPADTVIRHGIPAARTSFIQKPFLGDDLAHKIRTVLNG